MQYGKRVVRIEDQVNEKVVHFEEGTSVSGYIIVGAEDSRSVVHKHFLRGHDVMKPLPIGSLVGQWELSNGDFARQLALGHFAYIVINSAANNGEKDEQCSLFAALDKVSPDAKTGYHCFILHWIDERASSSTDESPYWTVTATRDQLTIFARRKTEQYPEHLRVLIESVPVSRYKMPGITLQSVELTAEQRPATRAMVIGDAAHSHDTM